MSYFRAYTKFFWLGSFLSGFILSGQAEVAVRDDLGREIILTQPARKVISLAPHLTEIVYALGGDEQIVATVAWSDFPEAAKQLPVIGSNNKINFEALLLYNPDVVLVWNSGNGANIIQKLDSLGLNVYVNEPRNLESIPRTLNKLGRLLGREKDAAAVSERFESTLSNLRARYGAARPVDVYYQIWQSPLLTFGGGHLVTDVMALCGGNNVFSDQLALVPRLGVESVLAADPEVIIIGQYTQIEQAFEQWRKWPQLTAVKRDNLYQVDPYQLHRHTPRILEGAKLLCQRLQQARDK